LRHRKEHTKSEQPQPNIGVDLIRIHRAVTRGLAVSLETCTAFAKGGFPDTVSAEGFWWYCNGLEAVALAHHVSEDELFFPCLRERLPDQDFDGLSADHEVMHVILGEMQAAREASSLTAMSAALAIPFLFYNLEDDDRTHFMSVMPPQVTQELVPFVWKDIWAPMKPFLLD